MTVSEILSRIPQWIRTGIPKNIKSSNMRTLLLWISIRLNIQEVGRLKIVKVSGNTATEQEIGDLVSGIIENIHVVNGIYLGGNTSLLESYYVPNLNTNPPTENIYDDIDEMLSDQANQTENFNQRVIDSSADPESIGGEAVYFYKGIANGLMSDYVRLSDSDTNISDKTDKGGFTGTSQDIVDMFDDIDFGELDTTLPLTSVNTSDVNVRVKHIGGINEINSPTDVTLTIQPFSVEAIPAREPILYQQKGEGNIIVSYANGASGPPIRTYKKLQTITILREKDSLNVWDAINPPQEYSGDGGGTILDGLKSTSIGEAMTVQTYDNVVGVYARDFDESKQKSKTHYIILPNPTAPITQRMEQFGNIVSGFEADDLIETTQGQSIPTWFDSYGNNDGTATAKSKISLDIVDGKKEVKFEKISTEIRGGFSLGKPDDLNFIAKVDSFSIVYQIGKSMDMPGTIVSWAGSSNSTRQYSIAATPTYTTYAVGGDGAVISYDNPYAKNQIGVMTYDAVSNRLSYYISGSLVDSRIVIESTEVNNIVNDLLIGDLGNYNNPANGNLRGLWFYSETLSPATILNIENFKNS